MRWLRSMRPYILCVLLGTGLAQRDTPPDSTLTLRVSTQLVLLDASVEDKKTGRRIDGLTLDDFTLTEDKVPQTLSYLSEDRLPLSVLLMFDLTDTVRPMLKPLAAGAHEVLSHLKPEDEIAVMVFSSRTKLLQDFTTDHTLVAQAIDKASAMRDTDGTFIHEDVFEATGQAAKATIPNSRRVEVWLTDGTANYENDTTRKIFGSQAPEQLHTRQEATDLLVRTDVVVGALIEHSTLSIKANPFMYAVGRFRDIEHYAALTGGPVLKASKLEVADRLASLIDSLRQRYTLGYRPQPARPTGTLCHPQLRLSATFFKLHPEISAKDVVVRTKEAYVR